MWERFTEHAKAAVTAARTEAARRGGEYVRTEHVLLGLCQRPRTVAARALATLGVAFRDIHQALEEELMPPGTPTNADEITFTPRVKKVLEDAVNVSQKFGNRYIGTGHLLLGFFTESGMDSIAGNALKRLHLDSEKVMDAVQQVLGKAEDSMDEGISESTDGFGELLPAELLIDPGTATPEEIADFLYELSKLYRMLGGEGIRFEVEDCRETVWADTWL